VIQSSPANSIGLYYLKKLPARKKRYRFAGEKRGIAEVDTGNTIYQPY